MRPTKDVLAIVQERDDNRCAYCGYVVTGERGFDWSLHHRRNSGSGGDPRPETHAPGNLVLLHGSGTTYCHGTVESRRDDSRTSGFLISKLTRRSPSSYVIEHAVHGLCYLLDDGSVRLVPTPWTEG